MDENRLARNPLHRKAFNFNCTFGTGTISPAASTWSNAGRFAGRPPRKMQVGGTGEGGWTTFIF